MRTILTILLLTLTAGLQAQTPSEDARWLNQQAERRHQELLNQQRQESYYQRIERYKSERARRDAEHERAILRRQRNMH